MACYKRKDGKWRVVISYTDSAGKKQRRYSSAKTRKEAIQKEALMLASTDRFSMSGVLFGTIAEDYLKRSKEKIRLTTWRGYNNFYRLHLSAFFKDRVFLKITSGDVEEWKSEMRAKGYKTIYLNHAFSALRVIFSYAKKEYNLYNGSLEKAGRFTENPNAVTQEETLHYWTPEEYRRFILAADKELSFLEKSSGTYMAYQATKVIISIMYFCGLRKGEANALLVDDFHDGDHPYLSITKSVTQQLGLGHYLITNPKNKSSVRDVPVCQELAKILREHIQENILPLPHFGKDVYLVYGASPMPNTTLEKYKNLLEKEAGIPHIRIHDLRHSFASMLINAGIPIGVISKLCGHSSPEITYRIYSHLYPVTASEAVDKMEAFYKKSIS